MDPLTHTLTGAVLGDSGLARKTPLAATTLLIAVNLPDVDALSYAFATADSALGFRRGWTHGVLAVALLPLLLAAAIAAADRWRRRHSAASAPAASFRWLLFLAYLGVATHPFLDWLNVYGIRLLMPFDGRWFYGDTLFIVDPWIWLVLGGTAFVAHSRTWRSWIAWGLLAAAATALFVSSAAAGPIALGVWLSGLAGFIAVRCAAKPSGKTSRRLARAALAAVAAYVAALHLGSTLAHREVAARLPELGIEAQDIMIAPLPARPLAHAVVIAGPRELHFATYDRWSQPTFRLDEKTLPRPPDSAVVDAALAAPCLRGLASWVRYPWVELEEDDRGTVVHLMDARYTRTRTSGFGGGSVRIGRDLQHACDDD